MKQVDSHAFGSSAEIMVVDDVVVNLRLLLVALQNEGYVVRAVPSGVLALQAVQRRPPDIILLDVDMPHMDGFEVCRRLKSDPTTRDIPIIFISAIADTASKVKGFDVGGADYITKPFHLPEVLSRIDTQITLKMTLGHLDRELFYNQLISDFARSIVGKEHFLEISQRLLETLRTMLKSDHAFASELDSDSQELLAPEFQSTPTSQIPRALLQKGFAHILENVPDGAELCSSSPIEGKDASIIEAPEPFTSFMMVTAGLGKKTVGALIVANSLDPYVGRDVEAMQSMAHLFALALTRYSRQKEKLQKAHAEIRRKEDDRAEAEGKARKAFSDLSRIFHAITSGMQVVDLACSIISQNRAMESLSGVPSEECIGKKCWQIFPTSICQTQECPISHFVGGGKEYPEREVIHTNDKGWQIACKISAVALLDENGNPSAVVEMYRDISEQKRLESIAQAVNSMNNVGYVFSGIRHELGNPVNALKMNLSVLMGKLHFLTPKEIEQFIERSMNDITRLEYLLKSLKSFSMFDEITTEPVRLCSFFKRFLPLIESDLHNRKITLDVQGCTEAFSIRADPRALQQVLLNLCTNAMDALEGRDNPRIIIYAKRNREESSMHLFIEDNGIGMTERQKSELFRPFYTNKKTGTGLGLVLARKMLAQMNALISIGSTYGEGTRVKLTFEQTHQSSTEFHPF